MSSDRRIVPWGKGYSHKFWIDIAAQGLNPWQLKGETREFMQLWKPEKIQVCWDSIPDLGGTYLSTPYTL